MKNLLLCGLLAALSIGSAYAQLNTLTGTTLGAAVSLTASTVTVAATTGIVVPNASTGVAGSLLYVQGPGSKGEAMRVQSFSGLVVTVARGVSGTARQAAPNGALVLIGPANQFYTLDPTGGCTTASTYVTPYVNIATGNEWLCSTVTLTWVPGFGNTSRAPGVSLLVASAAGAVLPSGPLFHINGTAAITGFTTPLGIHSGDSFCALSDAVWTWTAAGNIAILGTTTAAGRTFCFVWDAVAVKWYPSTVV